jgi:hypothetical protein
VEDERRGGAGVVDVLDGVQLQQQQEVVAGVDLAVDGGVVTAPLSATV